ncbi:MAG: 3'-5' exonuclease [archaeon]
MIVFDIETSGLSSKKCGIISIGAVCLDDPNKEFYEEAKLDEEDVVEKGSIEVNGLMEEQMREGSKQTQKEMVKKFLRWVEEQDMKMLAGHNVGFFDLNFVKNKMEKYGLEFRTRYRSFDLCTAAQLKYFQINKEFLLDELRENAMNLSNVLKFCGIKDRRVKVDPRKGIVEEGTPHNALEDAKLTAECFSRLMYGKNLFPEFNKFEVPKHLEIQHQQDADVEELRK